MNDKLTTTTPVPAYLKTSGGAVGADEAAKYVSMPRLKIIQAQCRDDELKASGEGALFLMPDRTFMAEPGQRFTATPVYFWASFARIRDNDDNGPETWIEHETTDATSDTARTAKDWDRREQPYPDNPKLKFTFVELLNFTLVMALDDIAVFTYMKGSHKIGRRLCSHVAQMARKFDVSIYGTTLEFYTRKEPGKRGIFQVLDFAVPENPWTPKDRIAQMAETHEGLAKAQGDGALGVDRDEADD